MKNFISLFALIVGFIYSACGQSAYSTLYCENDTIYNGGLNFSKDGLTYRTVLTSNFNNSLLVGQVLPGKINGICINKSGSTSATTGNIGAIQNVIEYISTEQSVNNLRLGKLFKAVGIASREPNQKSYTITSVVELDQTLFSNNKLNSLGRMKLGVTTYSSSQSKGNYFVDEKIVIDNNDQFANVGDSSMVLTLQKISGNTFPSDNANYQNILGNLSAFENTGWLIEVDRLGDKFNGKRYDLGRGNRVDFFINSTRSSGSANALASVTSSYQIFGDTASVIIKSQLTNGVQKFFVYNETNSIEDYFVLINDVVGGVIQPMRKEQLMDIYNTALKIGGTLFPKLSSITYSSELGKLLISVQGGKYLSSRFSEAGLVGKSVLSSLYSSYDDGFELNVKYGSILFLDMVSNKLEIGLNLGNTGLNGRVISNPLQLSVHNFDFQDLDGRLQSLEYIYLTEDVTTNAENQNPVRFSNNGDFQNEVYGSILTAGMTLDKNQFKLLGTLPKNSTLCIAQYNECYIPLLANLKFKSNQYSNSDSLIWIDGFAHNYITGNMCKNSAIEVVPGKMVKLFPNPISKSLVREVSVKSQFKDLVILYDSQGRIVCESLDGVLNVGVLNSGIYFVHVGTKSEKLLIID